jgi:hypothetical protein
MSQNEHYPRFPRSRPMRYTIGNSRTLLLVFGAAMGAVVGVALDLPGYWLILPAIAGTAVGLAASHEEPSRGPSLSQFSGVHRRRSPRHFGDPPP